MNSVKGGVSLKKIYNKIISLFVLFTLLLGSGGPAVSHVIAEYNGIETEELELEAEQESDAEQQLEAEPEAKEEAPGKTSDRELEELKEEDKKTQETQETKETESIDEKKGDDSSPSKTDEVNDDTEEEVQEEVTESAEVEEDEEDEEELLENIPAMFTPAIPIPAMGKMKLSGGLVDTIKVNKTATRTPGCRTFEVNLDITGEPQEAPVDVVLVIDRSGSMNETSSSGNDYFPIVAEPATNQTYYVKVGNGYQQVSRSGNVWRYSSGGWPTTYRYFTWDPNGNDSAAGGNNANNAVGKPFYVRGNSRLYYAKKAAINFAAKVLGSDGIPGSRVSIVSFAGPTAFGNTGHDGEARLDQALTDNLASIQNTVNSITANGGTNTQAGYRRARQEIQDNGNPNANKVVIMFTDGMPNASDKGATLQSHENTTVATIHTNAAIEAAGQIFNPGIADVFSVGLFQGMSGPVKDFAEQVLTAAKNKGYYDAPTAQDLDQIFDDIATHLGYAATNAKVVDKIGDNFELIRSSLPAGATYNSDTREITWNPGTIYESAQLKYTVVAKPNFPGGPADTNKFAKLTYKDIFGVDGKTKGFPVPNVNVPTLIKVSLTDATINLGDSINLGSGTDENGENYMSPVTGGDNDGETFTYEWRKVGDNTVISNDKNPSVSPTEDTRYELTVIDSNGCKAKATMWVRVISLTDVTVKKTVTGNMGDMEGSFSFTVKVEGEEEPRTFELSNGKTKTLYGIPRNAQLTLTETDNRDHDVTVTINSSEIFAQDDKFIINLSEFTGEAITIEVTNHRNILIDTGVTLDSLLYILILLGAVFGLAIKVIPKKNYE